VGAYSDRVIADGATHYWRLGEPSGTTAADSIAGGANAPGTISAGITLGATGPLADGSKAMGFPGGTTANIQTTSITIPLVASLEVWIKTLVTSGAPAMASTRGLATGSIVITWLQGASGATAIFSASEVDDLRIFNDGAWHHVVWTMDGTTVIPYRDGVAGTAGPLARGTPSVGAIALGWDQGNPQSWNGSIAEVAIYPTALSAPTISAHYALRTATGGGARSPIPWGAFAQQGSPA